ncbi:MAG: N-acetyltransferase, partial [Pseudomonadota bacterium]
LGWNDALSVIAPANTPSRRLAERLGAKAGEAWTDMSGHETILYRHDLSARGLQSSTTSPG